MWSERIYLSSLQSGGHKWIKPVRTHFPLQLRGAILLGSSDMQGNSSSGSNTAPSDTHVRQVVGHKTNNGSFCGLPCV